VRHARGAEGQPALAGPSRDAGVIIGQLEVRKIDFGRFAGFRSSDPHHSRIAEQAEIASGYQLES
jgi:hypothetical protein